MDLILPKSRHTHRVYLYSGIAIFASALLYYIVFRSQLPWPGYLINLDWAHLPHFNDHTHGSYPSFAFALSMGLIGIFVFAFQRSHQVVAVLGVWAIGLLHEIALGTFAGTDVLAGTIGAAIALLLLLLRPSGTIQRVNATVKQTPFSPRIKMLTLMLVSATFATGTSEYEPRTAEGNCIDFDINGTCIERALNRAPTYLSYTELRSAVKFTQPQPLTSVSRIYLYNNMLFANEKNQGIHIIDNSVPSAPERIGFIEIPGNTEISIRDDNLYADSYIDLVTIDVSDMNNITEIAREESIFPYNARQNIPSNVYLTGRIDSSRGVVVGYQ